MRQANQFANLMRAARRRAACLLQDESGQSMPILALIVGTFLFGFVALGIDGANVLHKRRLAQAAADAAAVAAAEEVVGGDGSTDEQNAAKAIAKLNGFDTTLAKNPATVTIGAPGGGNYSGSSNYLQVVVAQPIATYFAGIKIGPTVTVSGRGVAAANLTAPTCICLEGTSGMDLNMSNNAKLSDSGCGVTVDSNSSNAAQVIGSASVTATSIGSISTNWYPSGVNNGGSLGSGTKVVQGISTSCAPPVPTAPTYTASQCGNDPLSNYGNGGSTYSVGPGSGNGTTQNGGTTICYNSLTVGSNGDAVTLTSGIYVINGGELHFLSGANNASNKGGNGVFFYLVGNASLVIDNGANVNLTASTSGTYAGILVYQVASDTNALSVQGGSNTSFNGAIYAPGAAVTLGNGSNSTIDANIAAQSLTMNGGGTLNSSATSGLGTLSTSVAKLTE